MNYQVLYQWREKIANHLPSLNSWQQENVALFSQGIIKAENCQQQQIARQVACGERVESAARRFRRFLANRSLDLDTVFEEWTRWVLSGIKSKRVYLAVDETKLSDRIAAMVVGLAWEGRCIPLAWCCYKANDKSAYPPSGQVSMIKRLLGLVHKGIPIEQPVLVMADRGIGTSPDLCRAVDELGWHYLFRVTRQSKIVTQTGDYTIYDQVGPGQLWATSGKIFKQRGRIPAHARAIWSDGYDEPWALVTNDPNCVGFEYALRNWQEQSFRDLKSCGWQWQASHIRQPAHMEHLLILLAIAYGWIIALGAHAVFTHHAHPLQRHHNGAVRRHWSLFKEGLQYFVEVVERYGLCLKLNFIPDHRFG